jgi:hypothetical protein
MDYARYAKRAADAVLADTSIAKQIGIDAEQPVIVQGMHNRDVCLPALSEDRWRKGRKPVVNMDHIGSKPRQGLRESVFYGRRDHKETRRSLYLGKDSVYRVVVNVKTLYLDSMRIEQPDFRVYDGVFPARLLIPIMNHENFHAMI